MAHTDHHTPRRFWELQGLVFRDPVKRYRCACHESPVAQDVRLASRRARRTARYELRCGREPLPYRPRHQVRWDAL